LWLLAYASRAPKRKCLASALAVVVVAFLAYSLPPYVTGGTRVPATFGLHYPLLVAHVMFASVAMVTAVAQIWPGLRARRPAWHRRIGRLYVYTAIPAAVCAMVIGAATPFGPFLAVGNVFLASLGCGSRSTVTSPHGNGGSRSIGVTWSAARRWRCPSSPTGSGPRCWSSRSSRCRTACLGATKNTSCGWWPAWAAGWAGQFRSARCSGG